MKKILLLSLGLLSVAPCLAQEDMTKYIVNAGFDEDLTWQEDGSKKSDTSIRQTELSNRSIAFVTEDGSLYATVNPKTPNSRSDGRTYEATNGFVGQIKGWEWVTPRTKDACEWVYFGTLPYDLEEESIPIADDGTSYMGVPVRPKEFDGGTGVLYLRAGWGGSFSYKQEVRLPCAQYRLEYWSININPNTTAVATDLSKITCRRDVFMEEGGAALTTTYWSKHEFEFTPIDKFTLEFGFRAGNSSSLSTPWVLIDGVKLYKIGEADPEELLRSDLYYYVDEALPNLPDALVGTNGDYFNGLVEEAEALQKEYFYDGDDVEKLQEAVEKLKGLYESMIEAGNAARRVEALYQDALYLLDYTHYPAYDNFASYCDEVYGLLFETANTKTLSTLEESLQQAIAAYKQSNIPEDLLTNYNNALNVIEDGKSYYLSTKVNGKNFYLNASGYLTADAFEAAYFMFSATNDENTLYPTGWDLGHQFTNPTLTGESEGEIIQIGHLNVAIGNNRNDWERQVFFLGNNGKYAVRATNADSENWGAGSYWTVVEYNEQPAAGYSFEADYIWQLEEEDFTKYIVNASFDEDLTFQIDGTMKEAIITDYSLSDRSWAYIAEDSTLYARPKSTSSQYRPDGRKLDAVNGFIGRIKGWTVESSAQYPGCEWVYFGNIPYGLGADAVPTSDDNDGYLYMPEVPTEFGDQDNVAAVYMRAGWGGWVLYKQEVSLPCAQYRLEYWTKNCNSNSTAIPTNLTKVICRRDVFQEEAGSMTSTEWTKHEFEFTPTSGFTLQFGFKSATTSSNANPWVLIDGIKLYKIGDADPMELLRSDLYYYADVIQASLPDSLIGVEGEYFSGLLAETDNLENEYFYDGDDIEKLQEAVKKLKGLYETMLEAGNTARRVEALYYEALYLLDNTSYPAYGEFASYCEDVYGQLYETANAETIRVLEEELQQAIEDYKQSDMPYDVILGDANLDGSIDVVDVTTTVDFILGKAQPNDQQFQNTDVNKDESIDVVDLTSIVSIILGNYNPGVKAFAKAPVRASEIVQTEDVLMIDGTDIALQNSNEYVAFQMDITLADDATLNKVILSNRVADHEVAFNKISETTYRIVVYSLTTTPFSGNQGVLFSLNINGNQHLDISNIKFTDANLNSYTLNVKDVTGVSTPAKDASNVTAYDLNGRPFKMSQNHAIRIIDGKMVIIK